MELLLMVAGDFAGIYNAMVEAFPREERRDRVTAEALLSTPCYRIYHAVRQGVRVGFIALWELGDFVFVEHFVIYPIFRCRGYGAQVLACLKERYTSIVLEAEHPETEIAVRRLAFYERCGFVKNSYPYLQPSYHGEAPVPLVLMSYPTALTAPEAAVRQIHQTVYMQ